MVNTELKEAIKTLDLFTDYFTCPTHGCETCRVKGYCSDFEGRTQMLAAIALAISTLQEVHDGLLVELPCRPDEFWTEKSTGRIIRVVRYTIDAYGTFVIWRYRGERAQKECNPLYFQAHFTREAAEKGGEDCE